MGRTLDDILLLEFVFEETSEVISVSDFAPLDFVVRLWGEVFVMYHFWGLLLDEANEFSKTVLEVMRQPIEDKTVTISRARGTLSFPANSCWS
jgi:hypothetical protein